MMAEIGFPFIRSVSRGTKSSELLWWWFETRPETLGGVKKLSTLIRLVGDFVLSKIKRNTLVSSGVKGVLKAAPTNLSLIEMRIVPGGWILPKKSTLLSSLASQKLKASSS